jgi:hypothetical protein
MRRVLEGVSAAVLCCFGLGLLQAADISANQSGPGAATLAKHRIGFGLPQAGQIPPNQRSPGAAAQARRRAAGFPQGQEISANQSEPATAKQGKPSLARHHEERAKETAREDGEHQHESQAASDRQLYQAEQLLEPPYALAKLQQARTLLATANADYDGHRVAAMGHIEKAMRESSTHPKKAVEHLHKATHELNMALSVR